MSETVEKILYAFLGAAGGFLTSLLKSVLPGYKDLVDENARLREEVRELEDVLADERESRAKEKEGEEGEEKGKRKK